MKVICIMAALMNRHKPMLVNGGVGFATFAVGDVLSQGARSPPAVVGMVAGQQQQQKPQQRVKDVPWQQLFADRSRDVDLRRSAKVGLLRIFLNGASLGAWYRVLDRCLGADRTRIQTVLSKCVVDQMVYAPFSITSFVSYAAVLNGGGVEKIVGEARRNLQETFWSTWLMDWKVWPMANLFMFRFLPSYYRPSFASMVQVGWQAYMSTVSYERSPHVTATVAAAKAPGVPEPTLLVRAAGGG